MDKSHRDTFMILFKAFPDMIGFAYPPHKIRIGWVESGFEPFDPLKIWGKCPLWGFVPTQERKRVIERTYELGKQAHTVALTNPMLEDAFACIFEPLAHQAFGECMNAGLFSTAEESGKRSITTIGF